MLSAILSWLQRLSQTIQVKLGIRCDDYDVETENIGDQRVEITVRNKRTGEEVTNTAAVFTQKQIDGIREARRGS